MRVIRGLMFISCFAIISSQAQNLDISKCRNWKIYKIYTDKSFLYPIDTLKNFPNVEIDSVSAQRFLRSARELSIYEIPVWMGVIAGSCELEQETRMILWSVYAGFFYDRKSKKYYEVPNELHREWNNKLNFWREELQNKK